MAFHLFERKKKYPLESTSMQKALSWFDLILCAKYNVFYRIRQGIRKGIAKKRDRKKKINGARKLLLAEE